MRGPQCWGGPRPAGQVDDDIRAGGLDQTVHTVRVADVELEQPAV